MLNLNLRAGQMIEFLKHVSCTILSLYSWIKLAAEERFWRLMPWKMRRSLRRKISFDRWEGLFRTESHEQSWDEARPSYNRTRSEYDVVCTLNYWHLPRLDQYQILDWWLSAEYLYCLIWASLLPFLHTIDTRPVTPMTSFLRSSISADGPMRRSICGTGGRPWIWPDPSGVLRWCIRRWRWRFANGRVGRGYLRGYRVLFQTF